MELASYVPKNIAKKFCVVPVKLVKDTLYLAMSDPLDFVAQEEVKVASRKRVIPMIATRRATEHAISLLYGSEGTARVIEEMKREAGASTPDIVPVQLSQEAMDSGDSAPTIRFVNSLIERAFSERASDIHLEPQDGEMVVRMRIDGLLRRVLTVPSELQSTVISRLKIMGGMNIAEHMAKDQKGNEVPDVSWDIISSESGIASFTKPVTAAAGTTSATTTTVKNLDEGETNLMIYAIWKLDGKEYRGSTVLAVTTLKSNVLGVASGGSYCEGMLNQTLTGWAEDKQPRTVEYGTDAPGCEGSTLFLYSHGAGVDLSRFTVKSIAARTADALSGTGDYTAVPSQVQKNGEYTCLPITLYGKTESTTLTITLTDENGSEYCFADIRAKAQTSVTATFEYPAGTTVLTRNMTYGTIPSINTTDTDNVSSLEPPEGYRFRGELTDLNSWTPTIGITAGLRRPTVFTPILVGNNATDAK